MTLSTMTLPAAVVAVIRSVVQAIVSAALSSAWGITLTTWLHDTLGLSYTEDQITTAAFGLVFGFIVWLTNYLGKRWPWLNKVISLGTSSSPAVYEKTDVAGGGGPEPETSVDTGGEDMGLEQGAASVDLILVVAAIVLAILSLVGIGGAIVLPLAVICLGVAHLT